MSKSYVVKVATAVDGKLVERSHFYYKSFKKIFQHIVEIDDELFGRVFKENQIDPTITPPSIRIDGVGADGKPDAVAFRYYKDHDLKVVVFVNQIYFEDEEEE